MATMRPLRWRSRNRKYGRLSVNIQCDGDLMYAPGYCMDRCASSDSAAHSYAQQSCLPSGSYASANHGYRPSRGIDRAHIGTSIANPNIDYAKLAQSMGIYAEARSQIRMTWLLP